MSLETLRQATGLDTADTEPKPPTLHERITDLGPQLEKTLPSTITSERFTRNALTVIRQTPRLAACEFDTLAGALLTCAQIGLEPGPLGHCWLIPRKGRRKNPHTGNWYDVLEAHFQLGYTGAQELARRSGLIGTISAGPIYDWDELTEVHGSDSRLEIRPKRPRDPEAEPVAYWCHVEVYHGTDAHHVMERHEIDRIMERATRFDDNKKGPWFTDYDAMARITVFRAMRNWLPQSPQMAAAFQADQAENTTRHVLEAAPAATAAIEPTEHLPKGIPPGDLSEVPDGEPFEIHGSTANEDAHPGESSEEASGDGTDSMLGRIDEPVAAPDAVKMPALVAWAKEYLEPIGITTRAEDKARESVDERIARYAGELDCETDQVIAAVLANEPPLAAGTPSGGAKFDRTREAIREGLT